MVEQRELVECRRHGRQHIGALAQAGFDGAQGQRRHEDECLFGHQLSVGAGVDDGQRGARHVLRRREGGGGGERGERATGAATGAVSATSGPRRRWTGRRRADLVAHPGVGLHVAEVIE